jgi:transcription elongation factor GreB
VQSERKSNYITPEGYERLRAELEHLWKVERPRVTEQVSVAAALGDRSENADYIYGKKRLREIDRRLRFLSKRVDDLVVVHPDPVAQAGRVFFGAWVRLEDEEGAEATYRVVGPDEFDPKRGYISMDSPVGSALMGRVEGEEFDVVRPRGATSYTLIEIRYTAPDAPQRDGDGDASSEDDLTSGAK